MTKLIRTIPCLENVSSKRYHPCFYLFLLLLSQTIIDPCLVSMASNAQTANARPDHANLLHCIHGLDTVMAGMELQQFHTPLTVNCVSPERRT